MKGAPETRGMGATAGEPDQLSAGALFASALAYPTGIGGPAAPVQCRCGRRARVSFHVS